MKWLVVALVALSASAQAQTWPAKPVKLIVSQAAGGAPDILARLIADGLSKRLGQQFVVENRPGSANMVGAQAAARSAPDGATFFFATAAALVTNQYTFKELPYDPVKDFDAVAMVGKAPFLVVAHPSVPAKNMAQLLALDKADNAWDQDLAFRQLHIAPDFPFVLVAHVAGFDGISLRLHLEHHVDDVP